MNGAAPNGIRLKVMTPIGMLVDETVDKVIAEAENGSFCLLPRHVDFVATLVPGILIYSGASLGERFVAIDEGALVKRAGDVLVSTRNAVAGDDLAALRETVDSEFRQLDDHERAARSALARLEAAVVRRFVEFEGPR